MPDNEAVKAYLLGSQHSDLEVQEAFGLSDEQFDAILERIEIDECEQCGVWEEVDDLDDIDGELRCSSCVSQL